MLKKIQIVSRRAFFRRLDEFSKSLDALNFKFGNAETIGTEGATTGGKLVEIHRTKRNDPNEKFLPPAIASGRLFVLPTDGKETITVEPARPPPTALICPPCGIRFSSASTLEAHRTFYCAHRPRVDEDTANDEDDNDGKSGGKPESRKLHGCPHCSYRADKKVSLNRHMRMHAASPVPSAVPTAVAATAPTNSSASNNPVAAGQTTAANGSLNEEAERYCRNCDIRFSSLKTYRWVNREGGREVRLDLESAVGSFAPRETGTGSCGNNFTVHELKCNLFYYPNCLKINSIQFTTSNRLEQNPTAYLNNYINLFLFSWLNVIIVFLISLRVSFVRDFWIIWILRKR